MLEGLEDRTLPSGDVLGTATLLALDPLGLTTVVRESIESVNDADIFAVNLAAGDRLTVDVDARVLNPASVLDSFLRVFDSNGIVVAFSSDDASGSDSSLTYEAIANGVYYLGISAAANFVYDPTVAGSGVGGMSTGDYDLKVSLDSGDTLATAIPVTVLRNDRLRVSNAIDRPTDVDLFAIDLLAGDLVALSMPNFYGLDSVLRVFDSTGTQIALNDDIGFGVFRSGIGDSSTSNFLQVAAAGTYYVGVSSFGNYTYDPTTLLNRTGLTTGLYDLDIEVFDADDRAYFSAPPVTLIPGNQVTVSGSIDTLDDLSFFVVDLLPGDRIAVEVNTNGSGLNSLLRVFAHGGGSPFRENDDANGTDSALEVQTVFGGRFYLVVSGAGNQRNFYGNGVSSATTTGAYDLNITLTPFADLRVTALSIVEANARWGDQVTVNYVLDNQGRANAGPFMVELRASTDAEVTGTDPLLATIVVGGLAGRTSQAGSVMVQLPGTPLNPPAGFGSSAFVFVGSVIDRVDAVDESNESNNFYNPTFPTIGGYGRDLTSLVISSGSESELNDLPAAANAAPLNGTVAGNIAPPRDDGDGDGINELTDVDYFYVVLRGSGRLTVRVTAAGFDTRLSLLTAFTFGFPDLREQSLLAQSDARDLGDPDDLIVQHLKGGPTGEEPFGEIYLLRVEGLGLGSGAYTLTTQFEEAEEPFNPIPVGMDPRAVVSADFDRDGILDLVIANSGPNDLDDPTLLNDALDLGGSISILLGVGDGTYRPERRLLLSGIGPSALVVGHFNGDSLLDLAVASVGSNDRGAQFKPGSLSILLGNGDGTFGAEQFVSIVEAPVALATGDFDRDGNLDLVGPTINNGVRFYRGAGDGTFTDEEAGSAWAANPHDIVAADFDGDGFLDLATSNLGNQTEQSSIAVSRGRGDGSFGNRFTLELIGDQLDFRATPLALVTGDFNGDGQLDIATASRSFDAAIMLVGNGDGTFFLHDYFAVGSKPHDLVTGDFNGDGRLDLAAANEQSQDVSILLGRGDGNFEARRQFAVGAQPDFLVAADFDRDGRLDVATANQTFATGNAVILLGLGDGTLQSPVSNPVGGAPRGFVNGDFNRDGRLDVATANSDTADISILLGQGDGTLATQLRFRVPDGRLPTALATDDLNKDGRLDLAVVTVEADEFDHRTSNVLIYLGLGNGAFTLSETISVGIEADDVVIEQFSDDNGDGRVDSDDNLDVAVVNGGDLFRTDPITGDLLPPILPSISILLGNGGGKLRNGQVIELTGDWHTGPVVPMFVNLNLDLATGDFNGDGRADIAVALENPAGDALAVLLGNGDGTFSSAPTSPSRPRFLNLVALTVADFDLNGTLDLAAAIGNDRGVSVFRGLGDGTFEYFVNGANPAQFLVGPNPVDIIATDLNDDRKPDLAVVSVGNGGLSVLLGEGNGNFTDTTADDVLSDGALLVSGDFNGDGLLDLATVKDATDTVTVLLTQLELGGPSFEPDLVTSSVQSTPLLADFNGDGTADSAVINGSGEVLLRLGDPENAGQLGTAVVLNPGRPARAVIPYRAGADIRLAAIDATPHPVTYKVALNPLVNPMLPAFGGYLIFLNQFAYTVSLYGVGPDGRPEFLGETLPVPETSPAAPYDNTDNSLLLSMPSRIVTGNFNREPEDGFDDLAVLMPLGTTPRVSVLLANGLGGFSRPLTSDLRGFGPVDLTVADLNADGIEDILVTNQIAGAVEVMIEGGSGFFDPPIPQFRTGTGLFGVENPNLLRVRSADETRRAALADVNDDGLLDVIAVAPGAHTFSVLLGRGLGSFTNPQSIQVDLRPAVLVVGQFNDDNGDGRIDDDDFDDLAFLDDEAERIAIFLGNGAGGFTAKQNIVAGQVIPLLAGNDPTGLSAIDVNGDGRPDLQIGNVNGDVLTLIGNGDGTFKPYERADRTITLAAADLNGDGLDDFVYGNEGADRVAVEYSQPGQTFVQDREDGILSPGAVQLGDLNGDGEQDLVVANGGANRVNVYLGTGNGQFGAAREFFVGTNPVGITLEDMTGDGILDVIAACPGSNDVYVLAGTEHGNAWTLEFRTQVKSVDGMAPVSTTVVPDQNGDGLPDLLITNSLSNDVRLHYSTGLGTFSDVPNITFPAGTLPTQALVGNFNGVGGLDLLVLNAGSSNMTFYSNLAGLGITLLSGGLNPIGGIVGDFNKDGADDLVVANNGDGKIALFFGGKSGLELIDTQEAEGFLHPSALRFCSLDGDGLKVYLTNEGEESIARVTFDLDFSEVTLTGLPGTPPAGDAGDLTDSRPFAEVTDALIAALLADAAQSDSDGETTEKSDSMDADEETKPTPEGRSGLRGLIQNLFSTESEVLEGWGGAILDEVSTVLDVTVDVVRNTLQKLFKALNISWNPFANGAAQPGNSQKESPESKPPDEFDKPLTVAIPKEEPTGSAWLPRFESELTDDNWAMEPETSSAAQDGGQTRYVLEHRSISPRMADAFFGKFAMAAVLVSAFSTPPLVVLQNRKPNLREMGWAWFNANRR